MIIKIQFQRQLIENPPNLNYANIVCYLKSPNFNAANKRCFTVAYSDRHMGFGSYCIFAKNPYMVDVMLFFI